MVRREGKLTLIPRPLTIRHALLIRHVIGKEAGIGERPAEKVEGLDAALLGRAADEAVPVGAHVGVQGRVGGRGRGRDSGGGGGGGAVRGGTDDEGDGDAFGGGVDYFDGVLVTGDGGWGGEWEHTGVAWRGVAELVRGVERGANAEGAARGVVLPGGEAELELC